MIQTILRIPIIYFATFANGNHVIIIMITFVRGRTIGKDIKLVTRRAPPQKAKGKRKPLEQNENENLNNLSSFYQNYLSS